ncbi:MAG: phosphate/phosphite/phosphonate ABC transporter substrate-binding protein [Desulfomonile tiedjei]|uniref:Phosphate/phosphite/phosphonate ABC transporter substrate-binding protein n=1 Tax=Desulfomonile tiedjei TaxID=2358 RepID=A0A9D6Z514_9BACT|nr:phosphate/phosphite/phosphonate ABC transporter substrate-binding protein [Desulfomonile tiedjei]
MWTRYFLLVLLFFIASCSDEAGRRTVDFSQTIPTDQPVAKTAEPDTLRVAVGAMVSPKETLSYYQQLLELIGGRLGKRVELVQRKTYREVNDLLGKGEIDLAFICSGPYAATMDNPFELIATPEIGGSHFYQAYLIVNEKGTFNNLEDLKGHTFAFTDPDSNTGCVVPLYWLAKMGERPETFFRQVIYTYSHDNSIIAVAKGMVDGASVDGLVWDYFNKRNPALTSSTRIIRKSDHYGIPPLVASNRLPEDVKGRVRNLLFSLHNHDEGKKILDQLMIDRFVEPQDNWYDSIRQMQKSRDAPRS